MQEDIPVAQDVQDCAWTAVYQRTVLQVELSFLTESGTSYCTWGSDNFIQVETVRQI